jgi:hypothetical protein
MQKILNGSVLQATGFSLKAHPAPPQPPPVPPAPASGGSGGQRGWDERAAPKRAVRVSCIFNVIIVE